MSEVKIKLKIDDSGALETLRQFNNTFKQLNDTSKQLNSNLNKTFKTVKKGATQAAAGMKRVNSTMKTTTKSSKKLKTELGGVASAASTIKNVFAGVFIADTLRASITAIKNALTGAVNEFVEFEAGLVGVGKTANLQGAGLEALGQKLLDLDIPVSNEHLLELAKTAGQLGVTGTRDILKFTTVMAKLETATNVAGEAGASSIARILNVTGTAIDDVDKFGSALVQLGNTSAATEEEILRVAERVASSTALFNVSAQDTLAFGAALRSLGQRAESGGSSIGKLFKQIDKAVSAQGPLLEDFAEIMDTTGESLTRSFKADATGTVLEFLKQFSKNTENSTATLTKLGLSDQRVSATLGTLAKNIDVVTEKFASSRTEFEKNQALNEEYNRLLGTTESKFKLFKKEVSGLAIAFVTELGPAIKTTLEIAKEFVGFLKSNGSIDDDVFLSGASLDELIGRLITVGDKIRSVQSDLDEMGDAASRTAGYRALQIELDTLTESQKKFNEARNESIADGANSYVNLLREQANQLQKNAQLEKDNLAAQTAKFNFVEELSAQKESNDILRGEAEILRTAVREDTKTSKLVAGLNEREQAELAFSLAKINREIAAEEDKEKRAKLIAKRTQIVAKAEQDSRTAFDEKLVKDKKNLGKNLTAIARFGGKELFDVAKKFQLAQATVAGFAAIQQAASAAPFPANLPGIIAETARVATTISGINSQSFEQGGIVAGTSFSGDNVQANVNSGEMILNRQQQSNLFSLAQGNGSGSGQPITVHTNVQLDGETVARSVSRQVANGMVLGENL